MQCPACGTVNETGRKFCHECGSKLAAACPSCGSSNSPGARFCGECGAKLDAAAAPAITTTRPADAGSPAPVAERRMVTVLFADLVGFTTLAEGRDAEAVRELLSTYFELSRDLIGRYGGTVEKFIGDAVMAVWGAPTAHEDDAERAVRAAMELIDAVRTLGPEVQARAGVLTGEAAVTLGATDQGMVAGDLVNTASRLQSVAAPGTVLVGEATQRAASEAIAFEPAGETQLKGKESPVPAWRALRVVGERKGRGRSDRLEAPFVGRDAELRLLKDLFHATAREKRVRLVSITGQAGIGKSRLAWEFLKYVDGIVERVWWHEGRCPAYGEGVTFWALGEMVRTRADLNETDDAATTRTKVATMLAEHVPDEGERRGIEPSLLALLGVGEAPAGGRDELFRAWRTFFERLASRSMVTMLFEDLHWADPGLLDFIDHMLEWSRGVPILIVTLARPELLQRRSDWGAGRRSFLALGLEPLDDTSMLELLSGLAPGLKPATARSIVARADGIPLYAVETIRMLVGDGRLREVDGRYEPVGELGELAVPETLHALIAARLDVLEPADRSLLQDAAVLGQSFTLAGLSAVTSQPPDVLERRLRALSDMELVVQEIDPRSPERGQYAFVQALIREVAYSTLAKRDRRARHLAAARFFEALGEDELASALAGHYMAAWEAMPEGPEGEAVAIQARLALVGAAERASALGSPDQAITFLEQAAKVTTEPAERATILERLGRAASLALRLDEAGSSLTEAVEIRRALGDDVARFRATLWLADALLQTRRIDLPAALLEPAVVEAEGVADEADFAGLLSLLARVRSSERRYAESLTYADRALEICERLDLYELLADALATKGQVLVWRGRPVEGLGLLATANQLAEEHALVGPRARILNMQTLILAPIDPRGAFDLELEGLRLARQVGRRANELLLIGNAGEDALRIGEWDWQDQELATIDVELPPAIRSLTAFTSMAIRVLRGRPGAVEDADAFLKETVDPEAAADLASSAADLHAYVALSEGRHADARNGWMTQAGLSDLNAPFALPRAGRAAVLAGDAAGARESLARLKATGSRGGVLDLDRATIEAGISALEGRTSEAIAAFRSVVGRWRDADLPWDEAVASWMFLATIGASNADALAAGRSSRAILQRLEAAPIIAQVDALLARAGTSSDGPAGETATEGAPTETSGREVPSAG